MILTKTQLKILQVFTARITETFSIRQIGKELGIDYSLVYRAITPLRKEHKLLIQDKQRNLYVNSKENHEILSYVEYLRKDIFIKNPRNKDISLCFQDFIRKCKEESFVLLIFGSAVEKSKPRDIDILIIVDNNHKTEVIEKQLYNISRSYELDKLFHIVSISYESVYEMLCAREEKNVMNEVLNKHLIIHGAELFYRLLAKGRK